MLRIQEGAVFVISLLSLKTIYRVISSSNWTCDSCLSIAKPFSQHNWHDIYTYIYVHTLVLDL